MEGRPGRAGGLRRRGAELAALPTDEGASFDAEVEIDAAAISPMVTWGTTPGMVAQVTDAVPDPAEWGDGPAGRETAERALAYMALEPGTPMREIALDRVFIGSCTNSRIQDLREAADDRRGKAGGRTRCGRWSSPAPSRSRRRPRTRGSTRSSARRASSGARPGCSMCLGMNPDILAEGERCASTSNRNFEGRQGKGGRTHLVSPKMAAAAAVEGHFVDIREWA